MVAIAEELVRRSLNRPNRTTNSFPDEPASLQETLPLPAGAFPAFQE